MKTNAQVVRSVTAAGAMMVIAGAACAQSLFQAPIPPASVQQQQQQPAPAPEPSEEKGKAPAPKQQQPPAPAQAQAQAAPSLEQVSLMAVAPIKPRQYQKHDKVEIIINETSLQKHEQSMDNKKDYSLSAELTQFPSIKAALLQAALENGIGSVKPQVGVKDSESFKGTGAYERKDRFTARISALVLEVKPNGMLLVEAKEVMQSDQETKTMVVAGLCDPKDITSANTVQSSQLANLVIRVDHEGQVKDTSTKGPIAEFFGKLFGF